MAEYPAHLVHQHHLFDGRTVTIRPIRPDDSERERAFLSRLSEDSWYLRFHKWISAPSDKLVHFFTDVDYERHMAFVCTYADGAAEQVVGEARYVVAPDGKNCDFGIIVGDAWHKTGIAGLLMEALIRAAREHGLATIEGLVLSRNVQMRHFARALGFEVHPVPGDPTTVCIVKKL